LLHPDVITFKKSTHGIAIKTGFHFRDFCAGTKPGLFLPREILTITGITITENGTPGKGARFEITVPKGMWRVVEANREGK